MTKYTDAEIEAAAIRFELWADSLDPAEFEDITDLRDVATAADALQEAVDRARGRGRSWDRIAIALGVSRQEAEVAWGRRGRDTGEEA